MRHRRSWGRKNILGKSSCLGERINTNEQHNIHSKFSNKKHSFLDLLTKFAVAICYTAECFIYVLYFLKGNTGNCTEPHWEE